MTPSLTIAAVAMAVLLAMDPDYSVRAESIPCESYIPVHEMTTANGGVHRLVDGRRMVGKTHSVGGCGTYDAFPSGNGYKTNYTLLSYDSEGTSDACLVKQTGNKRVYNSFQGTVVEADGFKWMPKLSVDDIDALPTRRRVQGQYDAWRESALVFGIADGLVVYPQLRFSSGTMLARKKYTVKSQSLAQMGLNGLGDVIATGAEFNENKMLYNCPFADASTESRCRMSVEFTTPISKLVVLYAAAQKSMQDPNAAIFFSELRLPCSCMCSTTRKKAVMYTEDPLQPGTCIRSEAETETDRTACDILATEKVCSFEYKNTMARTGSANSDGNYPCGMVVGPTMLDTQPYDPIRP